MATSGPYELLNDWAASNQGFTTKGTKGGKTFFLKKYNNHVEPVLSESTKGALYTRLNNEFNEFKNYRIDINRALATVSGVGGNIIFPTEWFVDNHFFVEATEFVPGLIEEDEILRLSPIDLYYVMLTAAGALSAVHRKNIVHSDLKRGNIVVARNTDSSIKYSAKLIDFDKSYFADRLPCVDDLGGSQNYLSPELTMCMLRDFDDESLTKLSTKSDIFSLGIVFYNYLVNGEYPPLVDLPDFLARKPVVYPGEALCGGGKIKLQKSKLKEDYLVFLIANMIHPDPNCRPTANEVMTVLKTKMKMPVKPSDQIVIEGAEAVADTSSREVPRVPERREPERAERREEAPRIPEGFCEPFSDHAVTFDLDAIKAAGFVSMAQYTAGGLKAYALYRADGAKRIFQIAQMMAIKFATGSDGGSGSAKTPPVADRAPEVRRSETPVEPGLWEEDAEYEIDESAVAAAKLTFRGKAVKGSAHVYMFKNEMGDERAYTSAQLKVFSLLKKK